MESEEGLTELSDGLISPIWKVVYPACVDRRHPAAGSRDDNAMNLFDVLMHPDREELEMAERTTVGKAANLLQVGEFQFLQLAYRDWFGHDLPDALVDRLFTAYMVRSEVPHWARHYARVILEKEQQGLIDDNDPAYHRYDAEYHAEVPQGAKRFTRAVLVLSFLMGALILVAELSVGTPTTILPPYFEEEELRPQPASMTWGRSDSIAITQAGGTSTGRSGAGP